jgi:hypothetical protein
VLDLPLVLYNAPRVLRLRYRGLARHSNALLGIVVALEFGNAARNRSLLARGELVFASCAARGGCGALFVLRIDSDFRGVVACIYDVGPARCHGRGGVGHR